MKKIIKTVFNKIGINLRKNITIGEAFKLQKRIIGNANKAITIFDVGAYNGSISLKYNKLFPNSTIYSFEPFPESFESLKQTALQYKNIKPYNKGIGEYVGISKFHSNNYAPTNSILATHEEGDSNWGDKDLLGTKDVLDIPLTTLDQVAKEENIKKIDILKLDVQGAEHKVMAGAQKLIEQKKIRLIYTEIITIPTYQNQKELDEYLKMFREYGFELFTIYNSGHTKDGRLQFIDAIFVNPKF